MEMHEGEFAKRTSLTAHVPSEIKTTDVVIANEAANDLATKESKMEPSVEEPLVIDSGCSISVPHREKGSSGRGKLTAFLWNHIVLGFV